MISVLLAVLTSLGFGLGVALTLTGLVLVHQVFIAKAGFTSPFVMAEIGIGSIAIGLALLHFIIL